MDVVASHIVVSHRCNKHIQSFFLDTIDRLGDLCRAEQESLASDREDLKRKRAELLALESNADAEERVAARALVTLEIWRLHAKEKAALLASTQEEAVDALAGKLAREQQGEARKAELTACIQRLQAQAASLQAGLRHSVQELRQRRLMIEKLERRQETATWAHQAVTDAEQKGTRQVLENLQQETALVKDLHAQLEPARQLVLGLQAAVVEAQRSNEELAGQAM